MQKKVIKKQKKAANDRAMSLEVRQGNVEASQMFTDKRLNEELSVKQLGVTFNS